MFFKYVLLKEGVQPCRNKAQQGHEASLVRNKRPTEGEKPWAAHSLLVRIHGEERDWTAEDSQPALTLPDARAAQSFKELTLLSGSSKNQELTETYVLDDDGDDYCLVKRQWIGH